MNSSPSASTPGWQFYARKWGPTVVTVIVLASAYYYFTQNNVLEKIDLARIQPIYLVALVGVRLVTFVVLGLILRLFVLHLGSQLDFTEWFGLSLAGALVNALTPLAGGAVIRAGYLKLRHSVSISRYVAVFAVTSLLNYLVSGGLGLVFLTYLSLTRSVALPWIPALILIGLIVGPLVLLLVPLERLPLPFKGRLRRVIGLMLEGWRDIRAKPVLLAQQVGLAAMMAILQGIGLWVGILALGERADLAGALLMGALINAWRVTPGPAFGVQEAIGGATAGLLDINPAVGALAVLLNRAAYGVCQFTLGVWYTSVLSRRLGQPLERAADAVTGSTLDQAASPPSPLSTSGEGKSSPAKTG